MLYEVITDGGDELRMKYRYLDLRRNPVRDNLILRAKMAHRITSYNVCYTKLLRVHQSLVSHILWHFVFLRY